MIKFYLLLLLGLFLSFPNFIKAERIVNKDFELGYIEDINSSYDFESIKKEEFKLEETDIINLGISKSTLWVEVNLNKQNLDIESVLEISRPFLDEVILYFPLLDGKLKKDTLGLMYPYSKNTFNHFVPVFNLPLDSLADSKIYLRIRSRYSLLVPIVIKSKEYFYKNRTLEYLISGLLLGGLLLMAVYNLFLFFSTKDFNYVIYVLSLLGAIGSQGYIYGILIPFLSPEFTEFSFRFPVVIMALTGIFSCWFAIRFLNIKRTSVFFYYSLIFGIYFGLFSILIEFLHLDYLSRKVNIIVVISLSLIIFTSALKSLLNGNKMARFFTLAWTFYLAGMIIFALKTASLIPHNSFTSHFMHLGTFMEVFLLSFALGHKYKLVQTEKERLEKQTREELEYLVKKQTHELEISLNEKETLLKEIHHRVKNNLQIIMSLLDLQAASVGDSKNKEILAQSKSRVYSMSLIHQKLYQSENLARIDMKNYLEELFIYVKNSFALSTNNIEIESDLDNVKMPITSAVPLGLIVNELLTNCFKYGKSKNGTTVIKISFKVNSQLIELEIADKGKGFDNNLMKLDIKKSLGLTLVKSLTKQLRGEVYRFYNDEYFVTKLVLPKQINYDK